MRVASAQAKMLSGIEHSVVCSWRDSALNGRVERVRSARVGKSSPRIVGLALSPLPRVGLRARLRTAYAHLQWHDRRSAWAMLSGQAPTLGARLLYFLLVHVRARLLCLQRALVCVVFSEPGLTVRSRVCRPFRPARSAAGSQTLSPNRI